MKKIRLRLLMVLICCTVFFSACSRNKDLESTEEKPTYNTYFNSGIECMNAEDYEGAIQAFTSAIELLPSDVSAYEKRAKCYLQTAALLDTTTHEEDIKRCFQNAKIDYTVLTQIIPENVDYYSKLADVYLNLGDSAAAIETLTTGFIKTKNESLSIRIKELNSSDIQEQMQEAIKDNIWEMPWEIEEYHFLCPDGKSFVISVSSELTLSHGTIPYQIQDDMVIMHLQEDEASQWDFIWKWEPRDGDFMVAAQMPDLYVGRKIHPIRPLSLFQEFAYRQENGSLADEGWEPLMDLLTDYYKASKDDSDFAIFETEQTVWMGVIQNRISQEGIDTSTESGNAWLQYQYKKRVFDLVQLSTVDFEEPIYEQPSTESKTEDEAVSIEDMVGEWEMDIGKTQEGLDDNIYFIFGSGLRQYGSGMTISADGTISYGFAICRGGNGHLEVDGNCINITLDEISEGDYPQYELQMKAERDESNNTILVLTYPYNEGTEYKLYWKRK